MCYSGKCTYESNCGSCSIFCIEDYQENLGVSPCIVGGYIERDINITEEDKEKLDEKARKLNLLYK